MRFMAANQSTLLIKNLLTNKLIDCSSKYLYVKVKRVLLDVLELGTV